MPAVPLKLKKSPRPRAGYVLQDEVPVEEHRLYFGQQRWSRGSDSSNGFERRPTFRVGEEMHGPGQEIGGRDEVRVEDRNELRPSPSSGPPAKRRPLEAFPVGAVKVLHVVSEGAVLCRQGFGERMRLVGGIVQDLDLEQVPGVVQLWSHPPTGARRRSARCTAEAAPSRAAAPRNARPAPIAVSCGT